MNKHIRAFDSQSDYNAHKGEIVRPGVGYVRNDKMLYYLRQLFNFNPRYLWSDGSTSLDVISGKTPIGIEVIPASAMSNGKARFMSVKNMSRTDIENGTTDIGNSSNNPGSMISWGKTNDLVSELAQLQSPHPIAKSEEAKSDTNYWGILEEIDEETRNYCYGVSDASRIMIGHTEFDSHNLYPLIDGYYLPINVEMHEDVPTAYYPSNGVLDYVMDEDGNLNPRYSQSAPSCTSDFNGKENTTILVNRSNSTSKETGDSLDTNVNKINHPAAIACHRFNAGVDELTGQWYLPAAGELGFLWANIKRINDKLNALGSNAVCVGMLNNDNYVTDYPCYGNEGLGGWLWSSSQSDGTSAWRLYTNSGYLYNYSKGNAVDSNRVRAFLQL